MAQAESLLALGDLKEALLCGAFLYLAKPWYNHIEGRPQMGEAVFSERRVRAAETKKGTEDIRKNDG